jgi:hypothetical protein
MKKFFLSLSALLVASAASAGVINKNMNVGYYLLSATAQNVSGVQIVNNTATGAVVKFYDNNATNTTYTNGAYTKAVQYTTNQLQTFISYSAGGVPTATNNYYIATTDLSGTNKIYVTNTVQYTAFTTVGAGTVSNMPVMLQLYIPANSYVQYSDVGLNMAVGIAVANSGSTNVDVTLFTSPHL